MGEGCVLAAGQEGGGLGREREIGGVRQRVDPEMDSLEPPGANAAHDHAGVDPARQQLLARDPSALTVGDRFDPRIDRSHGYDPYSTTSNEPNGP